MFLRVPGWDFPTPTGALILAILAQVGFGFFPSQGDVTGVAASGTGPGRTICGLSAECLVVGFENIAGASAGNALDFVSIRSNDGGRRTAEMVRISLVDIAITFLTIPAEKLLVAVVKSLNSTRSAHIAFVTSDSGIAYIINKQRMLIFKANIDSR